MARKNLNSKRVFLDPLDLLNDLNTLATETNSCQQGLSYKLKESDCKHWIKVLRASVGQQLEVTCSKSANIFKAFITKIEKDTVYVKLDQQISSEFVCESLPQQHLFIGLPKSKSLELLIEKAVELSVSSINIWEARHSVAKLKENKELRLLKIIESAAKQSKQPRLAELRILSSLIDLENRIKELSSNHDCQGFICSLSEETQKIQSLELNPNTSQLIAIGPEGDFSEIEQNVFQKYKFQAIRLCSSVLRTETAAITALAMLQARTNSLIA